MIQRPVASGAATAIPGVPEPSTQAESPTEAPASVNGPAPRLIVEDDSEDAGPGQMKKRDFLSQLRMEVSAAADAILAPTGRSTKGCPYLKFWLDYYSGQHSRHIEQAIHRYAPEAARVATAGDYIGLIVSRVSRAVSRWAATGEITGAPDTALATTPPAAGPGNGASDSATTGGRQPGEPDGGDGSGGVQAVRSQLGMGAPLDASVRSRMESAFGYDFSRVRVHTDAKSAGLARKWNARAFAIGKDIAFGTGEYAPGSLIGNALIAHELAHVVQQGEGVGSGLKQEGESGDSALEKDANVSAIGAMVSALGGVKDALKDFGTKAMPHLRSGLRLQSCAAAAAPAAPVVGGAISTGVMELLAAAGLVTLTTMESDTPNTQSEMAQHGKGNVADTGIVGEAQALIAAGAAAEMCAALEILMQAARTAGDKAKMQRIKATQKAYGCRRHRE